MCPQTDRCVTLCRELGFQREGEDFFHFVMSGLQWQISSTFNTLNKWIPYHHHIWAAAGGCLGEWQHCLLVTVSNYLKRGGSYERIRLFFIFYFTWNAVGKDLGWKKKTWLELQIWLILIKLFSKWHSPDVYQAALWVKASLQVWWSCVYGLNGSQQKGLQIQRKLFFKSCFGCFPPIFTLFSHVLKVLQTALPLFERIMLKSLNDAKLYFLLCFQLSRTEDQFLFSLSCLPKWS